MSEKSRFRDIAAWSRFLEPAVIFAISLYLVYLFGAIYNRAYFGKFSFPYEYFDFLSTIMISRLIALLFANLIILFLIWPFSYSLILTLAEIGILDKNFDFNLFNKAYNFNLYYYLPKKIRNRSYNKLLDQSLFLGSITTIYILVVILINIYNDTLDYLDLLDDLLDNYINIKFYNIILLLELMLFLGLSFRLCKHSGKFIIKRFIKLNKSLGFLIPLVVIIILFCNIFIFSLIGDHDATGLIEGKQGGYEITFNSNDSADPSLDKTYMLVMVREGNYYFTEKSVPAPSKSTLYAMSVNKAEMVKINKIIAEENRPPAVSSLNTDKNSPQVAGTAISLTAYAGDPDFDLILYRFFVNNKPVTDWMTENKWVWTTTEKDVGENQIYVRVRDKYYASSNKYEEVRMIRFSILHR